MRRMYLVCQPETDAYVNRIRSKGEDLLSVKGDKQAQALANHFADIQLDTIISSTHQSAVQTAQKICKVNPTNLTVSEDPQFNEQRYASLTYGLHEADPELLSVEASIVAKTDDTTSRLADEETIHELFTRARQGLLSISENEHTMILVVTHSFLIRAVIASGITPDMGKIGFKRLCLTAKLDPASVCTLVQDDEDPEFTGWRLTGWNDTRHL